MRVHLTLLALAAFLAAAAASPAHADGVLYRLQESVAVRTPDPFFQPRVRVGFTHGVQFGHGRHDRFNRVGVGVGVNGYHQPRVDAFDLRQLAADEGRRAVRGVKRALRDVSGVVLGSSIETDSGRQGFDLVGRARTTVIFLTPAPLPATHALAARATPVGAALRLRLVVDGSSAGIPLTANEVYRLYDDPKAQRPTVLGGLIRRAWRDVQGDSNASTKGRLFLEARQGETLAGRFELPSLDSTIARPGLLKRIGGQTSAAPALDDELSVALSEALARAELLEAAGRPRARVLLERLRAGTLEGIGDAERAVVLRICGR